MCVKNNYEKSGDVRWGKWSWRVFKTAQATVVHDDVELFGFWYDRFVKYCPSFHIKDTMFNHLESKVRYLSLMNWRYFNWIMIDNFCIFSNLSTAKFHQCPFVVCFAGDMLFRETAQSAGLPFMWRDIMYWLIKLCIRVSISERRHHL